MALEPNATLGLAISLDEDQEDQELSFCACLLMSSDIAIKECGWLLPESFVKPSYAEIWREVLDGKDAIEAASRRNLLEVFSARSALINVIRPQDYAQRIADLNYMRHINHTMMMTTRAIAERKIADVHTLLEGAANVGDKIESNNRASTAAEVETGFLSILDNPNEGLIRTHIKDIDRAIGGYFIEEISVIATDQVSVKRP